LTRTNNFLAQAFKINAPDVDLQVTSAALGTTSPTYSVAQPLTVNYTVTNAGTAAAHSDNGSWSDYLYLSSDSTSLTNATFLTSQFISDPDASLAGGANYNRKF